MRSSCQCERVYGGHSKFLLAIGEEIKLAMSIVWTFCIVMTSQIMNNE